MRPRRRTALVSVVAALALIGLKLGAGLASGSLGLISEAMHSGTDLVAALLTFFAIGVAVRPADRGHPYGHGKAEHLAALAEATILVVASVAIAVVAVSRLRGGTHAIDASWYTFAVVGLVLAIDASRAAILFRAARRYRSAVFAASALHFTSDFAGSVAVLAGLALARAGHPEGDAVAALLVAVLVLLAAGRLIRQNIDVLMDRAPAQAEKAARQAIAALGTRVELRRLRIRRAAGRHFADVVIGVPPAEAVGQGHATADEVERAVERAVPGTDVVVHVEPSAGDPALRERIYAAALRVPHVRELHNLVVLELGERTEVSLHLKLPGELSLDEAHAAASHVEEAIRVAVPEVAAVQTHLEPLREPAEGSTPSLGDLTEERASIERVVRELLSQPPRELRLLRAEQGLVAFLTLTLPAESSLAEAHLQATSVEQAIREAHPEVADVIVHTEP